MALQILFDDKKFNTVMLLDTGARSEITFGERQRQIIDEFLGRGWDQSRDTRFRVEPLSAIEHPSASYDSHAQPHVGELDEVKLLAPQILDDGTRDANTMSLAYWGRRLPTIQRSFPRTWISSISLCRRHSISSWKKALRFTLSRYNPCDTGRG
jgi:hypothetical protein